MPMLNIIGISFDGLDTQGVEDQIYFHFFLHIVTFNRFWEVTPFSCTTTVHHPVIEFRIY